MSSLTSDWRRPCKFYFSKGMCLKGEQCSYSHDLSEIGFTPTAVLELQRQHSQDPEVFSRMAKDHPVEKWFTQPCAFYRRGYCDRGELCTFIHDPTTRYIVSSDGWVPLTATTPETVEDMGGWEKTRATHSDICHYYRQGYCSRGRRCRFLHINEEELSRMNRGFNPLSFLQLNSPPIPLAPALTISPIDSKNGSIESSWGFPCSFSPSQNRNYSSLSPSPRDQSISPPGSQQFAKPFGGSSVFGIYHRKLGFGNKNCSLTANETAGLALLRANNSIFSAPIPLDTAHLRTFSPSVAAKGHVFDEGGDLQRPDQNQKFKDDTTKLDDRSLSDCLPSDLLRTLDLGENIDTCSLGKLLPYGDCSCWFCSASRHRFGTKEINYKLHLSN